MNEPSQALKERLISAGVIERASLSPERDAAYRAGLQAALDAMRADGFAAEVEKRYL